MWGRERFFSILTGKTIYLGGHLEVELFFNQKMQNLH